MSLSKHSLAFANEMKRVVEAKPRNYEVALAKLVQNSIESWLTRMNGNKTAYPKMRVGLLGVDADSIEILIQMGVDVLHFVGQNNFKWFYSEEKPDIPFVSEFEPLVPYYPAFSMDAKERKSLYENNESDLLLGNPIFHPSTYKSFDVLVGIGSVIGPFCWLAPGVGVGKMVTIGAHVSISSDVEIGDYSHIDPNVSLQSGVRIGEGCRIGAGAVIFPNVHLAPFSVIGAGQIVKYGR